jgi:hypothetical protein
VFIFGAVINGYHSWLLKEFNKEPTYQDLDKRIEERKNQKKDD